MAANSPSSSARSEDYSYNPWLSSSLEVLKVFGYNIVATGGAGAVAKTCVAPLERVKILLQVQDMSTAPRAQQYRGLLDALRRIPAQEGWTALYRGNGANIMKMVPEVAVKFVLNDQLKTMFTPADGRQIGVCGKLAAGGATGLIKTLAFYPLDLIRTRITADTAQLGQRRAYPGVLSGLHYTLRREGLRGAYRGLGLSLAGVVPYLAVSFTAYDELNARLPDSKAAQSAWWFPLAKMGIGGAAGVAAQTVTYPIDTVRRRLQMSGAAGQAITHRGVICCLGEMLRSRGAASLYLGCGVNSLKVFPGAAIQFLAYDAIRTGIMVADPGSMTGSM